MEEAEAKLVFLCHCDQVKGVLPEDDKLRLPSAWPLEPHSVELEGLSGLFNSDGWTKLTFTNIKHQAALLPTPWPDDKGEGANPIMVIGEPKDVAGGAQLGVVAGASDLLLAPPDTKLSDAYGRVSRLVWDDKETIGTCARVLGNARGRQHGFVLTARHNVVCDGKCLKRLSAFGGELKFIAARPDLDMALLYGPSGPSFQVAADFTRYAKGTKVAFLSYPKAMDEELSIVSDPAFDSGVVSQLSRHGKYAATTFSTGMPNSSGGAVLTDTQTLAGVHVGIIYHLEEAGGGTQAPGSRDNSSGGSSNSGGSSSRPPSTIETDPEKMWEASEEGATAAAAADTEKAAELSCLNIGHKSYAGLCVTAAALWEFLDQALNIQEPVDITDVQPIRKKKGRNK